MSDDICFTPARVLARRIRSRQLSATEVVKAFIARIERVRSKALAALGSMLSAAG